MICACNPVITFLPRPVYYFAGLRLLNLSNNNLDDSGSAIIFDAVAHCQSLEVLYLEDNKAGFMAGKSLARLLDGDVTDSHLAEVYVGWNLLRGSASVDVAVALQKNFRLKVLRFCMALLSSHLHVAFCHWPLAL